MNIELLVPSLKNSSICVHDKIEYSSDCMYDWHVHDEYEIYMCVEGREIFFLNNKECVFTDGDIIFVNERIPHKHVSKKGNKGFLMQFRSDAFLNDDDRHLYRFINSSGDDAVVFKAGTEINKEIRNCIENIIRENMEKRKSFENFIKAEVYKIFAVFDRYDIIKDPARSFSPTSAKRILPALDYIDKHYSEHITLDDMSRIANVDRSHFCRIFKKAVNTSFVEYMNFVRICKAEKLLSSNEKNVSEIAEITGFSSVSYFTRLFKHYKNCTPSQYKKYKMS